MDADRGQSLAVHTGFERGSDTNLTTTDAYMNWPEDLVTISSTSNDDGQSISREMIESVSCFDCGEVIIQKKTDITIRQVVIVQWK